MKKATILLAFLLISGITSAQFSLKQQFDGSLNSFQNSSANTRIGDIDNDGDTDIITATSRSSNRTTVQWYENDGSGNFQNEHIVFDTTDNVQNLLFFSPYDILVEDIDNDNDLDIILALRENDGFGGIISSKFFWLENDSTGNFVSLNSLGSESEGQDLIMEAGDLEGDGNIDIVRGGFASKNFTGIKGNGNGGISSSYTFNTGTNFFDHALSILVHDLDNDGDDDVVLGDYVIPFIYESTGSTTLNEDIVYPFSFPSLTMMEILDIEALDFNDDGNDDIILNVGPGGGNFLNNSLVWVKNQGTFNFDSAFAIPNSLTDINQFEVVDYDFDSDDDIIVQNNREIWWHENLGNGSFAPAVRLFDPNSIGEFIIHDFDQDGDMDFIVNRGTGNRPTLYENFSSSPFGYSGNTYFDANQNKIKDSSEEGIPFVKLSLSPNGATSYSQDGNYFIASDSGVHTVQFTPYANWSLTTDSASYTRRVNSGNQVASGLDFGFAPDTAITDLEIELTGAFPRCDRIVNYWIDVRNIGTTINSGIIQLNLDDSLTFISASIPQDSIVSSPGLGHTVYFHYDSLLFFETEQINVQVQMPDFNSLGNTLNSGLTVEVIDTSGIPIYSTFKGLSQVLRCSYDPNDKAVNPIGVDSSNFIPLNTQLEYLIRFQNTGNDTAINVVISDQLSQQLDWNSLELISSSHPMQFTLNASGELLCRFDNIFLVDSVTNEPESHGFVKFSIFPKANLAPNTRIENTADIIFDNNPAIVTNTVFNTIACYALSKPTIVPFGATTLVANAMGASAYQWYLNDTLLAGSISDTIVPTVSGQFKVLALDTNGCEKFSDSYLFLGVGIEEVNPLSAKIFPNPFKENVTIQLETPLNEEVEVFLFDVQGKKHMHPSPIYGRRVTS